MYRPLRILTSFLCALVLAPAAQAGMKVTLTERAHWPSALDSPRAFDLASRAELAVFVEALAASEASGDSPASAASVARWKERMRRVLVENFAKARETCAAGALFCEGAVPTSWEALVTAAREGLGKLPESLRPWYEEQRTFHQGYLGELLRLAGLFPKVSSEILPLSPSERFGLELPDKHFLLTFDDGPSPAGGLTDALIKLLRQEDIHATFFLMGSAYEARREATSVEALQALYAGMCVGSHGQEHRPHTSWEGAREGLERFHSRLAESLPEGQERVTLFRPPYGQRTLEVLEGLERGGLKNVLWNIDTQDWHARVKGAGASGRLLSLMLLWRRGNILFHDIHPKALEVLPALWRQTKGAGVRWVDCRTE